MTATTTAPLKAGDIFGLANDNDVIVKNLKNNGRSWDCTLHDALYPERPSDYVGQTSRDNVLWYIKRYAERRSIYTPPEPEGVGHEPAYLTVQADPVVIEMPAEEDPAALEDAFNEGLAAGLALAAGGVTTTTTTGAISHEEHRDRIEQMRQALTLEHARELQDSYQSGRDNGYEAGYADKEAEAMTEIEAYENVIKAVRKNFVAAMATKAATIDAVEQKVIELERLRQRLDEPAPEAVKEFADTYDDWFDDQLKAHGVQ